MSRWADRQLFIHFMLVEVTDLGAQWDQEVRRQEVDNCSESVRISCQSSERSTAAEIIQRCRGHWTGGLWLSPVCCVPLTVIRLQRFEWLSIGFFSIKGAGTSTFFCDSWKPSPSGSFRMVSIRSGPLWVSKSPRRYKDGSGAYEENKPYLSH
jgi:hypothetical protein